MTKSSKTLIEFLRQLMGHNGQSIPRVTVPSPAPTQALRRDFVIPLNALAPSAHLDRVSTIVRTSFARIEAVNGYQAMARQQLDVADYALQSILDELRAVMPGQFPAALKLAPIHVVQPYVSASAQRAA
jgi:hypothetical protein